MCDKDKLIDLFFKFLTFQKGKKRKDERKIMQGAVDKISSVHRNSSFTIVV